MNKNKSFYFALTLPILSNVIQKIVAFFFIAETNLHWVTQFLPQIKLGQIPVRLRYKSVKGLFLVHCNKLCFIDLTKLAKNPAFYGSRMFDFMVPIFPQLTKSRASDVNVYTTTVVLVLLPRPKKAQHELRMFEVVIES